MKITMIIYSLSNGGAQRVMVTMANCFSKKNHDVTILTMSRDKVFFNIDSKITIKKLGIDKKSIPSHNFLFANLKRLIVIKKEMEKNQPDIVISFMTSANVLSTIAAKLLKIPIIISERTYHPRVSKIWGKLRRIIYPYADALVVLSPEDLDYYHFQKKRLIIKNPISFNIPKKVDFSKKEKLIVAAGRLHPVKGFDLLLKAFSKIENKKDWKLLILGEGSEREFLEQMILELNLSPYVEMPGQVNNIEDYLVKASIFVLSSRNEGFPNALVEGMAFGCAPISFNCKTGPNTIIQNKKNGYLIEEGNIEELSRYLKLLMENTDLRRKIALEAMKITEDLNTRNIMTHWEKLMFDVIHTGRNNA